MKTTAIIVAGGSGSRFDPEIPKQFVQLLGKTVLERSIRRFDAAPSVSDIVVVLPESYISEFKIQDCAKPITIVPGGGTRAISVKNGIDAVSGDTEIIAVHDAARPLVSVGEIESTVARAKESGAACLVARVTDTLKSVRGKEIAATIDRTKVRRALTPQVFAADLLRRAFETAVLDGAVTDECYLVEKVGHPIAIVEGSARNIKITHPDDILIAEALLRVEEGL